MCRLESIVAQDAGGANHQAMEGKVDLVVAPIDGLMAVVPESGFWGVFSNAVLNVFALEEDPA